MLNQKLTGQQAPDKTYIEDVFSTYLYTGNGSTQTINNGIDLAGKGGMVWWKGRNQTSEHVLVDTNRGVSSVLNTASTSAANTSLAGLTSFNSDGFTTGPYITTPSTWNNVTWTFRKAPKFFDVVTYTGNGVAGRQISHSLGQAPGMIIVKITSGAQSWCVWHRATNSGTGNGYLFLNTTVEASLDNGTLWGNGSTYIAPTATEFTVNNIGSYTNQSGTTYVAYLFAHDTTADGLIQCGSFTTDGTGYGTANLGWEPQYILVKRTNQTNNWTIYDSMRGWNVSGNDQYLIPNTSLPEGGFEAGYPTATGFTFKDGGSSGETYIYMAIRRGPMKTPTDGTKVFSPVAYTGTGANQTITAPNFAPDSVWWHIRQAGNGYQNGIADKLRGAWSIPNATDAEYGPLSTGNVIPAFTNTGFTLGAGNNANASGNTFGSWAFQRAPGFFDVVCYTGTGSLQGVTHNLGVTPELKIIKRRSAAIDWVVGGSIVGENGYLYLNTTAAITSSSNYWDGGDDSATTFSVRNTNGASDASGSTYVAYLFASCPGISKVGSYTGNGSSQTINCGFSGGARFVLIKRTDSTGDWYVWDTARGIVAGNDPHLSLNTTAAEVTTNDTIDPDSTGFIVNQVSATNVNVSGASYIYLAIA